jgi:hypothetical protein
MPGLDRRGTGRGVKRANWDRALPAMRVDRIRGPVFEDGSDVADLDDPENWYWLCPSCGDLLAYTKHPAYPLHCGVRCRILHHVELGYVVSEAETKRRAAEAETEAYEVWRTRLAEYHRALLSTSGDDLFWRWDRLEEAARRCQHAAWAVDGRYT